MALLKALQQLATSALPSTVPEVVVQPPQMRARSVAPVSPPAPQFLHDASTGFESNQPMLHDASVGYMNNPQPAQTDWYQMKEGGGRFAQEDTPWYKDSDLMNRMALGFNTMRLNPDQALAASLSERIKTAGELAKGNKTSQAVIAQLRNMGENEAADIVAANPAVAKEVLTQIVQSKYARKASPTASGVQIDPQTGQMFQVVFDPATNKNVRLNVEGATGETPKDIASREATQQALLAGQKMASEKGAAVFSRAGSLGEQINKLQRARDLVREGAQTGVIRSLLPSFDAATAELRAIGNSLGIDIINSATFGALSEKELSLALSTGLDLSLQGEALQKHIQDKISAQEKLYNQLMQDARDLSSGMTYNQYIQSRTSKRRESPIPIYGGGVQLPPNLAAQMSQTEIDAYNKLPVDMQQRFITGQ